jgi:hypothetical protein
MTTPRAQAADRRKRLLCEEAARSLSPRYEDAFCRTSQRDIVWSVRKTTADPSLEAILETPDRYLEDRVSLYKDSRSSTVGRVAGYVVKRYNLRRPWKWLKANLRGSYARRAFCSAYHLELAGIPGARAVAFGDRRRFGVLVASYLITREVPGAVPLGQAADHPPKRMREVARLFARLHQEGFRQLDPKPSNILIDAAGIAHLVDMDGIRFVTRVAAGAARTDIDRLLARLALVPVDRDLFVRYYSEASGYEL